MATESSEQWDCKACTMSNNLALQYCEACLQPRNNTQSEFNPYLDRDLIDASSIYSHAKNQAYMKQHEIPRPSAPNIELLQNDEKVTHDTWQCKLCTATNNIHMPYCEYCSVAKDIPICKCGAEMQVMSASVYQGISHFKYVECDICDNKIPTDGVVYHCPKKQLPECHPNGFDICLLCRRKYIHRLRYFAALIICPHIHAKDSHVLNCMFHKLGFHQIVCLAGNVTKESVETKLNELLPQNNENVNQFTVICYSGPGAWMDNNYYFALDIQNPHTWISAAYIKKKCQPTTSCKTPKTLATCQNDGTWDKTYYRRNTLLLINSCSANDLLSHNVESQQISSAFMSSDQSKLCETMLVIASAHTKHLYSYGLSVSSFAQGCSNFFDLFVDLQRKRMNVSPVMLFNYLQHCYDKTNNISLHDMTENIGSLFKMRVPKKELLLQRKMSDAFGIIGRTTGWSHEYHVITDPNTGQQLRTELLAQDVRHLSKNPMKNIRIRVKVLESGDDDKGKCYETYYLDAFHFPDLQTVKHVIEEIAKEFDKKAYNFGTRNCQTYGSILTARLYGMPSEYVRIKDKYWMDKARYVEEETTKLVKKVGKETVKLGQFVEKETVKLVQKWKDERA